MKDIIGEEFLENRFYYLNEEKKIAKRKKKWALFDIRELDIHLIKY
jgi:hypothetical protein